MQYKFEHSYFNNCFDPQTLILLLSKLLIYDLNELYLKISNFPLR